MMGQMMTTKPDHYPLPWTVNMTSDEDGLPLFGVLDAEEGYVCYSHDDKVSRAIAAHAEKIKETMAALPPASFGEG
ncbi:hypothetical protein Snov_0045 [Ancylobacter novellus DSM 506]|uniref:Uncharacterized protein n=1 Tax=Ancylobacter novellus (strain ATCC 8093 / DSM 506 / JCM 20403 / CCM 1077 / IAM 12100 / NBRC 12443 / NCIMB 10456) TaxID=639283 RepID=D6ZZW8_ANCN5|nr:hypothetical protein [Ancylobacter novellus]ADH87382.1 hypothetical protein Snov_0045 [Ancylobacter novellus DSM 506]